MSKLKHFVFNVLISISALLLIAGFVIAAQFFSSSVSSVDEDTQQAYNITVNLTEGGQDDNVTQINISLPSSFTFTANTNSTSAGANTFTNTSSADNIVLSWTNNFLVNGTEVVYFVFNATAATPGNFNLTVFVVNSTTTTLNNLSVVVNDTTAPEVQEANFTSPTTGGNYSGTLSLNISVFENGGVVSYAFLNITNSTGVQNATVVLSNTSLSSWNASIDTSHFPDGRYNVTLYMNDSTGNLNNSAKVYSVLFDNTNPSADGTCTTPVNTGSSFPCDCDGNDSLSGKLSESESSNSPDGTNIPSATGTFDYTCTITDYAGNQASDIVEYTIKSTGGSGSNTNSNSNNNDDNETKRSTGTNIEWKESVNEGDIELSEKGVVSAQLGEKERILLNISGESHHVGVVSISEESAVIEIGSTPQEVTFNVGDVKKFELNADEYYDIKITLVSITDEKAEVNVEYISEKVEDSEPSRWLWVLIVIAAIIIIAIIFLLKYKKK